MTVDSGVSVATIIIAGLAPVEICNILLASAIVQMPGCSAIIINVKEQQTMDVDTNPGILITTWLCSSIVTKAWITFVVFLLVHESQAYCFMTHDTIEYCRPPLAFLLSAITRIDCMPP